MSEVAREWRDYEGAQRYISTAVACPSEKSKEEAPNYNATTDAAVLWPDPLIPHDVEKKCHRGLIIENQRRQLVTKTLCSASQAALLLSCSRFTWGQVYAPARPSWICCLPLPVSFDRSELDAGGYSTHLGTILRHSQNSVNVLDTPMASLLLKTKARARGTELPHLPDFPVRGIPEATHIVTNVNAQPGGFYTRNERRDRYCISEDRHKK
jgi:hypothetical protein